MTARSRFKIRNKCPDCGCNVYYKGNGNCFICTWQKAGAKAGVKQESGKVKPIRREDEETVMEGVSYE